MAFSEYSQKGKVGNQAHQPYHKVALVTIGRVVLPAVHTARGVRAWHSRCHGGNRESCLGVSLVDKAHAVKVRRERE